jgi:acyl-CoA synthetase (AMP-forming)/AMP-acid ligase II
MSLTLVHSLKESVNRFPDRDAIVSGDTRISYQMLWESICSVSAYLRENGIKPGQRVAILLENSPEYVATYYAVLACGCVAVGLNTAVKSKDIQNWLKHCDASWLFTNTSHGEISDVLASSGTDLSIIGVGESTQPGYTDFWSEVIATEAIELDLSVLDDMSQSAAIIYTSGTTGDPKGVTLSHHNLSCNIRSILDYLHITESDSILNVLPFYYSYGNSILHTHLAVGARLVLENSMLYPRKIVERMAAENVTGFSGVPSTFALLLSRTKLKEYDLSSLRYLTQAGGPMAPVSINRIMAEIPHIDFVVMYGQTEASARLSYLPVEKLQEKMGSIGIAIPGVTLEIRDEEGNKTSEGVSGEIYATGENIMLGYWNAPELTKKVIIDGWLKTGDLAHYDKDGYIYIDGRSSEMIKVGANRISPKEIEEVIVALDEVEEVGAIGIPDEILGQVIKVFIVPSPESDLQERTVLAHCKKNLATYKMPKHIKFVTELPKTASGKIKRYLLQEQEVMEKK